MRVSTVADARACGCGERRTGKRRLPPFNTKRYNHTDCETSTGKLLHALSLSHAAGTPSARDPPTIPCIGPARRRRRWLPLIHPQLQRRRRRRRAALHFIQSFPFPVFVSRPNVSLAPSAHRPSTRSRRRLSRARRKKLL